MACDVYLYKRGIAKCARCGDVLLEHRERTKQQGGNGYLDPNEFPWQIAAAWTEIDSYYGAGYFNKEAAWPEGWMTRDLFPSYYAMPGYEEVAISSHQMIGSEQKGLREKVVWTICNFFDAETRLKKAGVV